MQNTGSIPEFVSSSLPELAEALQRSAEYQRKRAKQQGADPSRVDSLSGKDAADFRAAQKDIEQISHLLFQNQSPALRAAIRAEFERLFGNPTERRKLPASVIKEMFQE